MSANFPQKILIDSSIAYKVKKRPKLYKKSALLFGCFRLDIKRRLKIYRVREIT